MMIAVPTSPQPIAPEETAELAGRLRLAVTRLARLMRQQADTGLSPTVLAALASVEAGPLTLGELAAREQVAPPTVTKVVAVLEDQGLVTRRVDPADRRVARVEMTAEGRRLLERSRTRKNAWLARRLGALEPAERARLAAAVEALERLTTDGTDRR
jgi:DNA-binding MarR family transcriptional regulator